MKQQPSNEVVQALNAEEAFDLLIRLKDELMQDMRQPEIYYGLKSPEPKKRQAAVAPLIARVERYIKEFEVQGLKSVVEWLDKITQSYESMADPKNNTAAKIEVAIAAATDTLKALVENPDAIKKQIQSDIDKRHRMAINILNELLETEQDNLALYKISYDALLEVEKQYRPQKLPEEYANIKAALSRLMKASESIVKELSKTQNSSFEERLESYRRVRDFHYDTMLSACYFGVRVQGVYLSYPKNVQKRIENTIEKGMKQAAENLRNLLQKKEAQKKDLEEKLKIASNKGVLKTHIDKLDREIMMLRREFKFIETPISSCLARPVQRPPRYALLDEQLKKYVYGRKLDSLAKPLTEAERALALSQETQQRNTANVHDNMLAINPKFGRFRDRVIDKKEPVVSFITHYTAILQKQGGANKKDLTEASKNIHQYYKTLRDLEWAKFNIEKDPDDANARLELVTHEQRRGKAYNKILQSKACQSFFGAVKKLNELYSEGIPGKKTALDNQNELIDERVFAHLPERPFKKTNLETKRGEIFFKQLREVASGDLAEAVDKEYKPATAKEKVIPEASPTAVPVRRAPPLSTHPLTAHKVMTPPAAEFLETTVPPEEPMLPTLTPLAEAHDVLPYIKHPSPEMLLKPQEPLSIPPAELTQRLRRLSDSLQAVSTGPTSPKGAKKSEHIDIDFSEEDNEISFKWNPPQWKTEALHPQPKDVDNFVQLANKASEEAKPLALEFTIQGFKSDDAVSLFYKLRALSLEVSFSEKQLENIRKKEIYKNLSFETAPPQERPGFKPPHHHS